MKHLIPVMIILLLVSTSFVGVGNQVRELMVDNQDFAESLFYTGNHHLYSDEWNKTFGGPNSDCGYCVIQTNGDGYAIIGETTSYGAGIHDVWLIKTDSDGNEEWNKTYGGADWDIGYSIIQTDEGGYAITGQTSSYGAGMLDAWLIKTDLDGNEEWNKTYGGIEGDTGSFLQQTNDDGFVIVGSSESYVSDGCAWIIKTDSTGKELWNTTIVTSDHSHAYSIEQTSDGGYILTGWVYKGWDVLLVKLDADGNEEWRKTFGSSGCEIGYSVHQTKDEGYIITGYTSSYGAEDDNIWLIKTDSDGNKEWDKTYGGKNREKGYSCQITDDDGYIIVGITAEPDQYPSDILLIKTDSAGNKQWEKVFGKAKFDIGNSIQQVSDGGYVITGYTGQNIGLNYDVILIKVAAFDNQRPNKPTITGKTEGRTKKEYEYKIVTTDPEDNDVYYFINWGSIGYYTGQIETDFIGPYVSGEEVIINHTWWYRDNFTIKVMAIDAYGGESDFATLKVTIPKINNLWCYLAWLDRFPLLQRLLEVLI